MRSKDTIYGGYAEGREVYRDSVLLDPADSQKIWNHSPDGFNWGYGGSGPAQLALAILLDYYGADSEVPKRYYQDFKFAVIASLPQDWTLTGSQIEHAIRSVIASRREKIA